MTDDRWKTTFRIKQRTERAVDGDLGTQYKESFDVINIHNEVVVGSYDTERYAIKQARRRYKKLVKLMEKSFMSLA
jgi:hypothetical protein